MNKFYTKSLYIFSLGYFYLIFIGFLSLILFLPIKIFAQSYQLTNYQTDNGMPSNLTKSIIKDGMGFVWVASDEGVSRFDGRSFLNFKKELPVSYTKNLFLSRQKRFCVVNDLGIIEVDSRPDTVIFKTLIEGTNNTDDKNKVMYPKEIFEDCKNVWWISEPNSVLRYQSGTTKRYIFPKELNTTVYTRAFQFVETTCGRLYVGAFMGRIMYFNPQEDVFEKLEMPLDIKLKDVSAIMSIDEFTLWAGDNAGITEIKIDPKNPSKVLKATRILNSSGISFLKKESNGDIWAGTWEKGLHKIEKTFDKDNKFVKWVIRKFWESRTEVINHIYIDEERNLWLASDEGIEFLSPNTFSRLKLAVDNPYIQAIASQERPEEGVLVCDKDFVHEISKKGKYFFKKLVYKHPASNLLAVTRTKNKIFMGTGDDKLIIWEKEQTRELNLKPFGKAVFVLYADKKENIWAGQYGEKTGIVKVLPDLKTRYYTEKEGIKSTIKTIKESPEGIIYAGAQGKETYLYQYNPEKDRFDNISLNLELTSQNLLEINDISFDKQGQMWLGTTQGLWVKKGNNIRRVDLGRKYEQENIKSVLIDAQENVWIGTNLGVVKYKNNRIVLFEKVNGLSTVTISFRGLAQTQDGTIFVATANGLNFLIGLSEEVKTTPAPALLYVQSNNKKLDLTQTTIIWEFDFQSSLQAKILSFTYPNNRVVYQYRLIGLDNKWSEPTDQNQISLPRLPTGNYTLEMRAKQQGNYTWSSPINFKFVVKPAWYFTLWALLMFVSIILVVLWVSINLYTARLKKQKQVLTLRIKEATQEIQERAESLKQVNGALEKQTLSLQEAKQSLELKTFHLQEAKQNLEKQTLSLQEAKSGLEIQRDALESAYRIIERKNAKITDSIRYAQTIQQVILPAKGVLESVFSEHFVLFRPRDVVSGDFYWIHKQDNRYFIAVVDCTGHGVPGAFMSMIAYTLLYRIIKLKGIYDPANILTLLHEEVRVVLRQKTTNNTDGMDVCLCVLEKPKNPNAKYNLVFSGAKRPLYLLQQGEMKILEETRKAIGGYQNADISFKKHEIDLFEGDTFYLSSDGLGDQNNVKRKKFGEMRVINFLAEHANLSMDTQVAILNQALDDHQKDTEQRDDITFVGLKI